MKNTLRVLIPTLVGAGLVVGTYWLFTGGKASSTTNQVVGPQTFCAYIDTTGDDDEGCLNVASYVVAGRSLCEDHFDVYFEDMRGKKKA